MKELLFIPLFFAIAFPALEGQQLIRTYKIWPDRTERHEYAYDVHGNKIKALASTKNSKGVFVKNHMDLWTWVGNKVATYQQASWNAGEQEMVKFYEVVKSFDGQGCETGIVVNRVSGDSILFSDSARISHGYDCREAWFGEEVDGIVRFSGVEEVMRTKGKDRYREGYYRTDYSGKFVEFGWTEWKYNSRGQLTKKTTTTSDISLTEEIRHSYNPEGLVGLTRYRSQDWDSTWHTHAEVRYLYEKEDGLVKRRIEKSTSYDGSGGIRDQVTVIRHYEYYCDTLLKEMWVTDENGEEEYREIYEYDQKHQCDHEQIHRLVVFPNPSSGTFYVEGDVLSLVGTRLEVYDLSGNLIQEMSIDERLQLLELDMPYRSGQTLILKVIYKGGRQTSRVVMK